MGGRNKAPGRVCGRPDESLFKESERLLQAGGGDEPTEQETKAAVEFTERDPKDKGNRKVKYQKERSTLYERTTNSRICFIY